MELAAQPLVLDAGVVQAVPLLLSSLVKPGPGPVDGGIEVAGRFALLKSLPVLSGFLE